MTEYYLYRIDLMDTYPGADLFDDEKYRFLEKSEKLSKMIGLAVAGFIFENEPLISWQNWFDNAEDGGFDFIVVKNNKEIVFKVSDYFKSHEEQILGRMVDLPNIK